MCNCILEVNYRSTCAPIDYSRPIRTKTANCLIASYWYAPWTCL